MIVYPKNVTDIHIELTDKCQASCPMCARNFNGGAPRPFVGNNEITLDNVKEWFPPNFLKNIKNFYACGNYGDPIIAKDCLEIFEYVRKFTDARVSIHTNGSARTTTWWKNLASTLEGNHEVTFGIDGFSKSHSLYRRGTEWKKIIDNATAFINSGGVASVDCLVFKHNQDEIEDLKSFILSLGFKSFNVKSTGRFYDMEKFPVLDLQNSLEYYLEPADKQYKVIPLIPVNKIYKNVSIWHDIVEESKIFPKCVEKNEIYIDSRGNVLPCCWVGSDIVEEFLDVAIPIHSLRNSMVENTKHYFKGFDNLNLKKQNILEILNSELWSKLHELDVNKPWACVKNCKK